MAATILDGNKTATTIKTAVSTEIDQHRKDRGTQPCLAVILIGDNPASAIYVRHKRSACDQVSIRSCVHILPEDTDELTLLKLIDQLNADTATNGILVQLPLPAHIDADKVIARIAPEKDVDGFHPYNLGCLAQKRPTLRPCTPYGVMTLLQAYDINPAGQDAIVVGASNIVGRPMALELLLARATVTVCHSLTQSLADKISAADIVVAGMGMPKYIKGEWIKPGAVVIDVGINRQNNGKLCGDIEFEVAAERASFITPVPGGVGPMTVATLMSNTLQAYKRQHHLPEKISC